MSTSHPIRIVSTIAAIALFATVLSPMQLVSAQSQNEIVVGVNYDGTPVFDTDPADDGAGAHTPGLDASANNNVVRTYDFMALTINWTINEADATGVTATVEAPAGTAWAPDNTGMFAGCDVATSTIVGQTLTCDLGDQPEGSNGAFRPILSVDWLADGTPLTPQAVLTTNEDPTGVTDAVDSPIYVSEAPAVDWIKHKPEVAGPVTVGADEGWVVLFPISLTDFGQDPAQPVKGGGRIDATQALTFNDHMWDFTAGSALATPAQMAAAFPGRSECGAYDGLEGYPVANNGTWACGTATTPNGYPVIPVSITGYTAFPAEATLADGSANQGNQKRDRVFPDGVKRKGMIAVAGQIGIWMPADEVQTEVDDINNDSGTSAWFHNSVSGGADTVVIADEDDVVPADIPGSTGMIDELYITGSALEPDNSTRRFVMGNAPVGNPGQTIAHNIYFKPGPLQLHEHMRWGDTRVGFDERHQTNGGLYSLPGGHTYQHGHQNSGDRIGQVVRGQTLTISAYVLSRDADVVRTSDWDALMHGCVAFDTTHYELVALPAPLDVLQSVGATSTVFNNPDASTIGAYTMPANAGPLAHVETGATNARYAYNNGTQLSFDEEDFAFTVEFTDAPVLGGAAPFGAASDAITCDTADAGPSGWVSSTSDLSGFDPNGDGLYEGITRARITADPVDWDGVDEDSRHRGFNAFFNVRVKADLTDQRVNQELWTAISHSYGDRDPVTGTPDLILSPTWPAATQTCVGWSWLVWTSQGNDIATDTGWCNQPFADDGADSLDTTDLIDWPNTSMHDSSTSPTTGITDYRGASADVVRIVVSKLLLEKVNLAGPSAVADNGELVQFSLKPSSLGSTLEAFTNVRLTDALPANYDFVRFVQQPVTGPGCVEAANVITCQFSEPVPGTDSDPTLPDGIPGGWEDEIIIEVVVTGAIADPFVPVIITNGAKLESDAFGPWTAGTVPFGTTGSLQAGGGSFSGSTTPHAQGIWSYASSSMPLPADEAAIIKNIATLLGGCVDHPSGTVPAGWASACSLTDWDDDPSNGTTLDGDGNMTFTLSLNNHGNTEFTNIEFIDVFPHNADATEPASGTNISGGSPTTLGDGRTPPTVIAGQVGFVGLTGTALPAGATLDVWVTGDAPLTVSRDPLKALDGATTWCTPAGVVQLGTGACPATDFDVTAIYANVTGAALPPDETIELELTLDSETVDCADIWTNTFGARVAELALPIRSNDVSVMVACPEIGLTKEASTPVNNGDGTWNVAYTMTATNTGAGDLTNITITDDLTTVFGTALTSSTITSDTCAGATLANGDTCVVVIDVVVTPGANPGPYDNTASVTGDSSLGGTAEDDSQDGTDNDPDADGDPTNNSDPTSVSFIAMPEITATKTVSTAPVNNGDGTWTLAYDMTVSNTGDIDLTAVSADDDLAAVFGTGATIVVDAVTVTAPGTANTGYDGVSDTELLTGTDLAVGETITITIEITVTPAADGAFDNNVTVTGQGPTGTVTDVSQDGTDGDPDADGDPNNNDDPTTVIIVSDPDDIVDEDNTSGEPVTIDPLAGDDDNLLDPTTVELIDPDTGLPVTNLAVPGEGTWTVDPVTGEITFTPESGFTGNPTPIEYQVGVLGADAVIAGDLIVTYAAPATTTAPPPALAFTGRTTDIALRLAFAFLIVGMALVAIERRKTVAVDLD